MNAATDDHVVYSLHASDYPLYIAVVNTFMTGVWLLVLAGVLAWFVVSIALGLLIGRIIRNRDRQVPRLRIDHRYDPGCACADCERSLPFSTLLKTAPLPGAES